MSDVVYTVLVSPAGQHPWGNRRFAPVEVATLYVGGSAMWVFTSLHGRPGELTIRPAGPESEGGALLVGLAAGLGDDEGIRKALECRHLEHGEPDPIDVASDQDLIDAARKSLTGTVRLSISGEELHQGVHDPAVLAGLDGFDVEVLVPAPAYSALELP